MSTARRIPLHRRDGSVRAYVLVDATDHEWAVQYSWHLLAMGYAARRAARSGLGQLRLMHRELLRLKPGDPRCCDHINGDGLDNRRANLRIATQAENRQNARARGGTSRFRGVSWDRQKRRWVGYIKTLDRHIYCGSSLDEVELARTVDERRREIFPFAQPDPELISLDEARA